MLVLRRRPLEVIVFEGGLSLTLVDLIDHKAWLGFEAPSIEGTIALSPLGVAGETVTLGIRSPLSLDLQEHSAYVVLDDRQSMSNSRAMLALDLQVDDEVFFEGMSIRIRSITDERAGIEVNVPCLGVPITISVQSVSGIEARIGIDAPDDLRVMRKELWLDLLDANTNAAQWSAEEMHSLRTSPNAIDADSSDVGRR